MQSPFLRHRLPSHVYIAPGSQRTIGVLRESRQKANDAQAQKLYIDGKQEKGKERESDCELKQR